MRKREKYFHKNANAPNFKHQRWQITVWQQQWTSFEKSRCGKTREDAVHMAYLLCDCAGAFDELPFGEGVSGTELQGSSLLDQVDAAVAQLLHPCL